MPRRVVDDYIWADYGDEWNASVECSGLRGLGRSKNYRLLVLLQSCQFPSRGHFAECPPYCEKLHIGETQPGPTKACGEIGAAVFLYISTAGTVG